jgi:hypothetical protein
MAEDVVGELENEYVMCEGFLLSVVLRPLSRVPRLGGFLPLL